MFGSPYVGSTVQFLPVKSTMVDTSRSFTKSIKTRSTGELVLEGRSVAKNDLAS